MSKAQIKQLPPFAIKARHGKPPSHLVVRDVHKGFGEEVKPSSGIVVEYTYYPYGEAPPPSQLVRNGPDEVLLADKIEGWQRGLPGMRVGGRRELVVPTRLGDSPTTEVYIVDLLAVRLGGV